MPVQRGHTASSVAAYETTCRRDHRRRYTGLLLLLLPVTLSTIVCRYSRYGMTAWSRTTVNNDAIRPIDRITTTASSDDDDEY